MLRLGWFSTGRGEGSRGLLRTVMEQVLSGGLQARILFVFCNREPGEHEGSDRFMEMVKGYGLPLLTLSSRRFKRERGAEAFAQVREDYDREVARLIAPFDPDYCVLAGYMLIASEELTARYPMLNLHPAPPGGPAGTWQEVIWHLIREGAREGGAMVHLATPEVDRGPVVAYCTYPVRGPAFDPLWEEVRGRPVEELQASPGEGLPLFQAIRREGLRRERPLLVETLRALAQGRVRVERGRVVDGQGNPIPGLCLNREVEAWLARGAS